MSKTNNAPLNKIYWQNIQILRKMLLKVCAQKIQKTKQTLELLKAIEIFEKIKKTVRVDNLKIRTFVNTHVNAQAKTKTLKKYIKFTLNDFF